MTKQETFDLVALALVKQGGPSVMFGRCKYRGDNGRRCAAGHCIPDSDYLPEFEGYCIHGDSTLTQVLVDAGHDTGVLTSLQGAHDEAVTDIVSKVGDPDALWLVAWRVRMNEVARVFDLSTLTMDTAFAERVAVAS